MTTKRIADTSVMQSLEQKVQSYKDAILGSKNLTSFDGTAYYVSNNGSDENDGKSPQTAIATIAKVMTLPLQSGDAVLFERGGHFRGKIVCESGVTYSAYGDGQKPIINGSRMNFAKVAWHKVDGYENVYVCSEKTDNAGLMVFDLDIFPGNYEGNAGIMKNPDEIIRFTHVVPFHGIEDLKETGEFYNDLSDNSLYLYCDKGNPADVYHSIEVGEAGCVFSGKPGNTDVTIDNLFIMYTGSHGVGTAARKNLTVTNNIFAWIGGSVLKGYAGGNHTRYGNAVEIYGDLDGYTVTNNWIYQIYDTGITNQCSGSADGNCVMRHVEYKDNLIELCNWSIEYYNVTDLPNVNRILEDCHIHNNICRNAGYGWGEQRPDKCSTHCNSFGVSAVTTDTVIENNVFDRSNHDLVRIYDLSGDRAVVYRNNTYIQSPEKSLGFIHGKNVPYVDVEEAIEATYHEEDPNVYYTE